ncbi:MAG: oligopeptide transport system substrate-binding protein [Planctomycetota bacterium]|jgi:oligopeptide transport system substrate-binding protein
MAAPRSALRQGFALVLVLGLVALMVSLAGSARLDRADLTINNGAEVQTLDPATVTGVPEGRVVRALFEGLIVKHPRTLAPMPGMAESWEISEDGLTYTFHIRDNAVWTQPGTDPEHFDEPGRTVDAQDFVYSWERLLNPNTAADYSYQLWYVRGAKAYTVTPPGLFPTAKDDLTWLTELPDPAGTWQLGVSLWEAPKADLRDARVILLVTEGDILEAGAPLLAADGVTIARAPVPLTVTKTNPDLPQTLGALADAPGTWLLETQPEESDLEAAIANGILEDDESARPRLFRDNVGIRATDDRTLIIELATPTPYFLDLTGFYPLFPVNRENIEGAKERWPDSWRVEWLKPDNLVTNGPFRILERRVNDRIRLLKCPTYWDAENVAMNSIDILAVESYQTMLNMYLTGEVDWIDRVATSLVPRLVVREDFTPQPYLGTYFYRVNTTKPPFDDARVRRALALTIDRRAIVEKIMKAGQLPNWGFTPHGMDPYEHVEMDHIPVLPDMSDYETSFLADISNAKGLLLEAGFGVGGTEFPRMEIHYNTSEAHRDIAEVIADSWRKHLGIEVGLLNQEWKVYLDTQSTLGYDVSRSAWIGDYADPNTFLDLMLSGGENNKTGWGLPAFDALIEAAKRESDPTARFKLLADAERILMEELPILPIYTYTTQNIYRPRLGGFEANLQDEHFPKHFYWMDDEELEVQRAARAATIVGPERERVDPGGPPEGLYPPSGKAGVTWRTTQ